MKRLFFAITLFAGLGALVWFAGSPTEPDTRFLEMQGYIYDSIRVPTGTDTTVYVAFFCPGMWGINFDYRDFDAVDATVDLGATPVDDGTWFDRLDNSGLPFTLADSTVSLEKYTHNFRYLAIKLTKSSVTAGLYMPYYITYEKVKRN